MRFADLSHRGEESQLFRTAEVFLHKILRFFVSRCAQKKRSNPGSSKCLSACAMACEAARAETARTPSLYTGHQRETEWRLFQQSCFKHLWHCVKSNTDSDPPKGRFSFWSPFESQAERGFAHWWTPVWLAAKGIPKETTHL